MLTACAKSTTASVSIHGVNYTEEVFSYSVEDPADKNNQGGGELIDPYAAGGTMCCYELPKKWRPGIKLQINTTRWLSKTPDGNMPEVHEKHMVEVPPYVDGKPGELWVIRNADGTADVVSSDYQPDHVKWPGRVKGWPVPSLTYQRERWDLYIELAESDVKSAQELIADLERSPDAEVTKAWKSKAESASRFLNDKGIRSALAEQAKENRKLLARFTGSSDPKFREFIKQDYEKWLIDTQLKLKQLKESRP
jgi:hypothetical protein